MQNKLNKQAKIPEPVLVIGLIILVFSIFAIDFFTRQGLAVWILYIIPMGISLLAWRPNLPPLLAILITLLMVMGFGFDRMMADTFLAKMNRSFGFVSIWVIAGIGYYFIQNKIAVRATEWMNRGIARLAEATSGELSIAELSDNALKFLSEYMYAKAGAIFTRDKKMFYREATYNVPAKSLIKSFDEDDGILGRAAKDGKTFILDDIPETYISYGSALGSDVPASVMVVPMMSEGSVNAVVELGFDAPPDALMKQFTDRISEQISVALTSARYKADLKKYLAERQRQSEELQAQSEELRVTNEELEEQKKALEESQAYLEQQQTEVEQTNTQLEEQAQVLEQQKEELEEARHDLLARTEDLEQANQYKSDFLANMSHELRTPLNSTLILAKLLSENKTGNLTDEQVKFASTIHSAGNDLLNLINDILDLSKIEAGHMDAHPEKVYLKKLSSDLQQLFDPVKEKKGLEFEVSLKSGCPKSIYTDPQRLEQILKNLLSNAFKFTDKGGVRVEIECAAENIEFAVIDTGMGISKEKKEAIFEAFKQVDGTISRQYGGTGLGLSISRQLASLLGGRLSLRKADENGSVFVLNIPVEYTESDENAASNADDAILPVRQKTLPEPVVQKTYPKGSGFEDDREDLVNNKNCILVIEDDSTFAKILYDLITELNMQCIVAGTAEEGLYLCRTYLPNAVVLDIGLPDHSGLSVLDRLKQDDTTRHIPVHIISGNDFSNTALSLGAVDYMFKPVKRDELVTAMQKLEGRLIKRMRRVLIVEDNPDQLMAIKELIGSEGVETVGVKTAQDCLKHLKGETFDCMVLDLSLPDATGYELLQTLSDSDDHAFPPVIVYTGKDLTHEEEHRLRQYSQAIIIKGARSPERLLDEVSLFLHQIVSELPVEHQRMIKKARARDGIISGRRILIVEDDMRNVYSLTSILEPYGAVLEVANNGREALDVLEQIDPTQKGAIDLVLMDVMMPEMDGLTATRKIRQMDAFKKLPVIMLTAKAMKGDQEKCLEAGANDYMTKPIDVEKLLSLIRVWLPR